MKLAACKLPSQMWTFSLRGCPVYGPEWLFLSLCIAYCHTKPVVFNLFCTVAITATHFSPINPPKTQRKCNTAAYTKYVLMTPPKMSFDRFPENSIKANIKQQRNFTLSFFPRLISGEQLNPASEIWKWFVAFCLKYDWVNSVLVSTISEIA